MAVTRCAFKLLSRAGASGAREALVGDLLEEMYGGRSSWWLYRQLIGLYGLALAASVRQHARLTPFAIAVALGAMLLGAVSVGWAGSVLVAWLGFYLAAGTVSLFAHMMARAQTDVRL